MYLLLIFLTEIRKFFVFCMIYQLKESDKMFGSERIRAKTRGSGQNGTVGISASSWVIYCIIFVNLKISTLGFMIF